MTYHFVVLEAKFLVTECLIGLLVAPHLVLAHGFDVFEVQLVVLVHRLQLVIGFSSTFVLVTFDVVEIFENLLDILLIQFSCCFQVEVLVDELINAFGLCKVLVFVLLASSFVGCFDQSSNYLSVGDDSTHLRIKLRPVEFEVCKDFTKLGISS